MEIKMDIEKSPSGRIINLPTGYSTFIPHPLPPKLELDNVLVYSLSRADFLLGQLAREGGRLSNPHLLIRPFLTREAVLSSRIEGTQATLEQVLAAESGVIPKQNDVDLQEVQNYIKALDYGLNRLKEFPLSLRLIKEIHFHLMQGVRGSQATPGEFRRTQNWIGTPGCTLGTAKFVPPHPDYLMDCLSELERFLHNKQLPPLLAIGLCHYQFEAIHPFLDGNGRVGRLLNTLLLVEQKALPSPLLYLSAFFEATRDEYYRLLYNVSRNGAWNEWLVYFLNGIAVQTEDVLSRIERINQLLNQWKTSFSISESSILNNIIDSLAANPFLTINKSSIDLKIAYSTAQRAIKKLEAAGIVERTNENKRDKVYCAKQILKILDEPTKITPQNIF